MGDERDFFARIRQQVAKSSNVAHPGKYPNAVRTLPDDLLAEFRERLTAVAGHVHLIENSIQLRLKLRDLLEDLRLKGYDLQRAAMSGHSLLYDLQLDSVLERADIEVAVFIGHNPKSSTSNLQSPAFSLAEADLGLTGAEYAIAASGTIAVAASPQHPRGVSLLPPIHIAIIQEAQILPDLAALAERLRQDYPERPPSGFALITGPSKTADIEQTLSIGVHGPGELHVFVLSSTVED